MHDPTYSTDANRRDATAAECTTQLRTGSFCSNPTIPGAPYPVCIKHAAKLYEFIQQSMVAASEDPVTLTLMAKLLSISDRTTMRRCTDPTQAQRRAAQSVVYYLQIHDFIKIGTTTNLVDRLHQLRVDRDAVLATEPGNFGLESIRLDQFAEYRIGRRENFEPAAELLKHIADVRRLNGEPVITKRVSHRRYVPPPELPYPRWWHAKADEADSGQRHQSRM